MMREGGAPGMEEGDDADAGAQVLGVGCDCECGVGRCLHEQVIDHGLVLIGDVAELGRQGINHMKILDRQQFGLALGEPPARGGGLTLWAVAVATTVVGDDGVSAGLVLAPCNVATERRRAAALDCGHHLQLVEAHVPAVGLTPSGAVVAEDIRDLQTWPSHAGGVTSPWDCRASSLACGAWSRDV